MKKTIEKQLKKTIAKKQAGKSQAKEKLLKKDFESLKKEKEKKEITKAKEKLLNEKHLKEGKAIERKSKLESFDGLFENQNLFSSQFAFNEKDFFLHGIGLNENEKEKKLFYIYNKIESIGKGMNLNEIEKIILENLKKRLILEYCNNFEKNLKRKNAKDIQTLNMFFVKSHLRQYIKNAKEKESLNIFDCESENIFGKSSNDFEHKYIEKINGKFVLEKIGKLENEKAKASLQEKRNGKKLNGIEKASYLKNKNKLQKLASQLKAKENIKSEYNLKSKIIENAINGNRFLIKISNSIERIKRKVFERNGINLKEKELKKEIAKNENILNEIENGNLELTGIENLKILESLQEKEKELKAIKEKKKEIELKIYGIYKSKIEKIVNHGKATKEKELKAYKKEIASLNISKTIACIQNEYSSLLK